MPDHSAPQQHPPFDDAHRRDLEEKAGYGSGSAAPVDLASATRQTPPRARPNSSPWQGKLKDSWQPSPGREGWGPYFGAMLPPQRVTPWINFKRMSTGVNIARRLWAQRENLRHEYEAIHGIDRAQWPVQHPGVVLDAVEWMAHPACLTCQWFHVGGVYMRNPNWQDDAAEIALRQQTSGCAYRDYGRR
jgi:hypothetical protein